MSEEKKGFFGRLKEGLKKTRDNIVSGMDSIFSGYSEIDEDFYEEIEETLIMGDLGVHTTEKILEDLKRQVKEERIKDPSQCREKLIESIRRQMDLGENAYEFEQKPSVVLVIGVNGVGKTTSIGKIANVYKGQGKSVLLSAADTFRAAASEQLSIWAEGRLHNKKNLMNELNKIDRVISQQHPEASRETLLVLDATTGQNAIAQAKEFSSVVHVDGLILTKLDGTAKGGVVCAIKQELGIPVRYIGVGEGIDDLQVFDPKEFARALVG